MEITKSTFREPQEQSWVLLFSLSVWYPVWANDALGGVNWFLRKIKAEISWSPLLSSQVAATAEYSLL